MNEPQPTKCLRCTVRTTSEWYGRRGRARGPGAVFCSDEQTKRFWPTWSKLRARSLPRLWAYRAFAVGAGAEAAYGQSHRDNRRYYEAAIVLKRPRMTKASVKTKLSSRHLSARSTGANSGGWHTAGAGSDPLHDNIQSRLQQGHPPLRLGGRCLLRRKDPRLLAGSEKLEGAIFRGDRQPQRPRLPALRHGFDDKAFGCFAHADILATKAGGSIASGGQRGQAQIRARNRAALAYFAGRNPVPVVIPLSPHPFQGAMPETVPIPRALPWEPDSPKIAR